MKNQAGAIGPSAKPARKQSERGMAIMITAVVMLFLVPFIGLSVDAGLAFVIRGRLSAALDSAALAAERNLNLGSTVADAQTSATAAATNFMNANFPVGYLGTDPSARTLNATFTLQNDAATGKPNGVLVVNVTGSVSAPAYFTKILGNSSYTVSASGTATRRVLVMSLLLDESASMGTRNSQVGSIPTTLATSASSCEAMVYSAIQFINYFTPYDYIGVVAFDYTAHEIYAPSTNFKSSNGAAQAISNIQCGNNTNTTAALELGWRQIKKVGMQLAENEIVLFTDGVPNGITANFPVRTQVDDRLGPAGPTPIPPNLPLGNNANCLDGSGTKLCVGMPVACANNPSTVYGVISQGGGFNVNSGSRGGLYKAFDSDSSPTFPAGCPTSGITMVNQTLAYIPDTDAFGNSTHGPWDSWIYQVNQQCAPAGTTITSGNTLCKNMGDAWSNHAGTGAGAPSNFFQTGPYKGKFRPDLLNTIGVTSMNTAVNEATQIRADTTYNIEIDTVYLQGNGSDPVDRQFLQIVSNQTVILPLIYDSSDTAYANSYYQSGQKQGMWLATANNLELNSLFAKVASSLLRISQ